MAIIKHDFQRAKENNTRDKEKKTIPGFQLRIELGYSAPVIWRTLRLPGTLTLADLHSLIQNCFGWQEEATYRFLVGKVFYGPQETRTTGGSRTADTPLHELEEHMGFIFSYLYDGGCGWECELSIEEVIPDTREIASPVLIDGWGASPPAFVEDIHEYQTLLQRLEDSQDRRRQELAACGLPLDFDPEDCNIDAITALIRKSKEL